MFLGYKFPLSNSALDLSPASLPSYMTPCGDLYTHCNASRWIKFPLLYFNKWNKTTIIDGDAQWEKFWHSQNPLFATYSSLSINFFYRAGSLKVARCYIYFALAEQQCTQESWGSMPGKFEEEYFGHLEYFLSLCLLWRWYVAGSFMTEVTMDRLCYPDWGHLERHKSG